MGKLLRAVGLGFLAWPVLGLGACGPDERIVDAAIVEVDDVGGAPTDTAEATGCDACGVGTICVQRFDGVCTEQLLCVTTDVVCPDNACSTDCEAALCGGGPYQCENRTPCGTEVDGAFTCYGP